MDNIEDISQIAGKFKKVAELRQYSEKLFVALKKATEELQKKDAEITHLKELLGSSVPIVGDKLVPHDIDPAILLCEMEILRFKNIAQERPLNFEETKRFSILVNDLISLKKNQGKSEEDDHRIEQLDITNLIQLAKKPNE